MLVYHHQSRLGPVIWMGSVGSLCRAVPLPKCWTLAGLACGSTTQSPVPCFISFLRITGRFLEFHNFFPSSLFLLGFRVKCMHGWWVSETCRHAKCYRALAVHFSFARSSSLVIAFRLSFVIRIHAVHIMSSIARSSLWDTLLPWLLHYTCIGRDDAMPALTTRGPGLTDWH